MIFLKRLSTKAIVCLVTGLFFSLLISANPFWAFKGVSPIRSHIICMMCGKMKKDINPKHFYEKHKITSYRTLYIFVFQWD